VKKCIAGSDRFGLSTTWTFHITPLAEYCQNSKIGIFELLVWKETFAGALLTGIVSYFICRITG